MIGRGHKAQPNDAGRVAKQVEIHERLSRRVEAHLYREESARLIWAKVCSGALTDGFTRRAVHQRGWHGLSTVERVSAGLAVLVECGRLRAVEARNGGRPTTLYWIEPLAPALA